jgi:hypothetical protein
MKNVRNLAVKYGPRLSVVGGSLAVMGSALAQSTDPVDAAAALSSLSGSLSGFGPVLFGLALTSTVIMIGVAWIKKGRGAAK